MTAVQRKLYAYIHVLCRSNIGLTPTDTEFLLVNLGREKAKMGTSGLDPFLRFSLT